MSKKKYYLIVVIISLLAILGFNKKVFSAEIDIDRTHLLTADHHPALCPPNFCKHLMTDIIEQRIFQNHVDEIEKLEQAKPTLHGADHLTLSYGQLFPLKNYFGETPAHQKITPTLFKTIDSKKLGLQEALLQAEDPATHLKKYLAVAVEIKDTSTPKITGQKNLTTTVGTKINLLADLKANDVETGDLTASIQQTTTVNFNKVGTYTLVYQVSDRAKNTTQVKAQLTITAKKNITQTLSSPPSNFVKPLARSTYAANTLYFCGAAIPYQNGGTASGYALINTNPNGLVSTYYGASFNGDDGQFTHFIGHSPGIFTPVKSLSVGSQIIATNASCAPTSYTVYQVIDLSMTPKSDGFAYPTTAAGQNLIDALYCNQLAGEKIVLQTCMTANGSVIRFVYASR